MTPARKRRGSVIDLERAWKDYRAAERQAREHTLRGMGLAQRGQTGAAARELRKAERAMHAHPRPPNAIEWLHLCMRAAPEDRERMLAAGAFWRRVR